MAQTRTLVAEPRRRVVFIVSLMATFIAAVEGPIVGTAMPTIVANLSGFNLFSWVYAVYFLSMAVSVPLYGRLADLFGRKRVYFAGTAIWLVGTTLCGFAPTMLSLVLFRVVQGLGTGAILLIPLIVLGDIYTPAERARMQGYYQLVVGISGVAAPALGSFIVQKLHWSLIFWVNLPVGIATIVMYQLFLHEQMSRHEHQLDLLGAALLLIGIGAAMLAFMQAPTLGTASVPIAFLGVVVLALLVLHERRAPEPIVPYRLWRNRIIMLANLCTFGIFVTLMGVAVSLPVYVQGVLDKGPTGAGLALGCLAVSWPLGTFASAFVMNRTSYRMSAVTGGVLLVVATGMLSLLQPANGIAWVFAGALTLAFGMGFCSSAFLVSVQASVDRNERGAATGSLMFMRLLGQCVGSTLFGAIVNLGVSRRLDGAGEAVRQLLTPTRQGLDAAQIAQLQGGLADAVHEVYIVVLMVAILTLAMAVLYPAAASPTQPALHARSA